MFQVYVREYLPVKGKHFLTDIYAKSQAEQRTGAAIFMFKHQRVVLKNKTLMHFNMYVLENIITVEEHINFIHYYVSE